VAKHLLDETAEFTMPTIGRHMTDDDTDGLSATRPLDGGAGEQAWAAGRHQADRQLR
jgi:hypothetical protein